MVGLKKILLLLLLGVSFVFCEETLPVYRLDKKNRIVETPAGELTKADWVKALPVPKPRGKRASKEPPRYVPVSCRLGTVYVKRADFARFVQESGDLSGEYASPTGSVFLKKSPNNPKRFNVVIQNGPAGKRAEIEMGDLEIHMTGRLSRSPISISAR